MNAHTSEVSGEGYGYVYIMSYPHSDKLKIGHSLTPTTRASEIGGTLAPENPTLEAYFWCSERRQDVERQAHRLLSDARANGEWFKVSKTTAVKAILEAAQSTQVKVIQVFSREANPQKISFSKMTKDERKRWIQQRLRERQASVAASDYGYDAAYVKRNSKAS